MEKRLFDLVELVCNNAECVVLKVKDNALMDLVCLGCFDGTETMFRITKGDKQTVTVWCGEKAVSWGCDYRVCDELHKRQKLIDDCVVGDFGIALKGSGIEKTLHINSKETRLNHAIFEEMWWQNDEKRCIHLNGEFFRHFKNHDSFLNWLDDKGWKIIGQDNTTAKTGCIVNKLTCQR